MKVFCSNPICILILLALAAGSAFALDPFYPPGEWERYVQQISKERAHEQPIWVRPEPGKGTATAIQTLVLPDFKVDAVDAQTAFDEWQQACDRAGVKVPIFVDPAVRRMGLEVTHHANKDSAAVVLSFLQNLTATRVTVLHDRLLVGLRGDLDPHALEVRVWALSDRATELLGLQRMPPTAHIPMWSAAENVLGRHGAAFPVGAYADFRDDFRLLVSINTKATNDSVNEWIGELESHAVIDKFRNQPTQKLGGYSLEVRSFALEPGEVQRLHSRLKDAGNRLQPFAENTLSWSRSRGLSSPDGSAAWLDVDASMLWIRNRPDQIDLFAKMLSVERAKPRRADSSSSDSK